MKNHCEKGFTLVELSIVLFISAILATIMFSTYSGHVRKSRRVDAKQTLQTIQLEQERYRTNHSTYGSLANIGAATKSSNGYYNLSVSGTSATAYTITATATGSQTSDKENGTSCTPLILTMSNGTETKTPAACW